MGPLSIIDNPLIGPIRDGQGPAAWRATCQQE